MLFFRLEFVSTLTAQELAKGVNAITELKDEAQRGFKKIDTIGKQVVDALIEAGNMPIKIPEASP